MAASRDYSLKDSHSPYRRNMSSNAVVVISMTFVHGRPQIFNQKGAQHGNCDMLHSPSCFTPLEETPARNQDNYPTHPTSSQELHLLQPLYRSRLKAVNTPLL